MRKGGTVLFGNHESAVWIGPSLGLVLNLLAMVFRLKGLLLRGDVLFIGRLASRKIQTILMSVLRSFCNPQVL